MTTSAKIKKPGMDHTRLMMRAFDTLIVTLIFSVFG